jgi:hypothetical protein
MVRRLRALRAQDAWVVVVQAMPLQAIGCPNTLLQDEQEKRPALSRHTHFPKLFGTLRRVLAQEKGMVHRLG